MKRVLFCLSVLLVIPLPLFAQKPLNFDVIIKGGTLYEGTGAEPRHVDLAIRGDRIVGLGDFKSGKAKTVIDANGLAVAPGFINMLSWSTERLIQDGRSQSEIRKGDITETMGQRESMRPGNDRGCRHLLREQADIRYDNRRN